MNSKLHLVCDGKGMPVHIALTAGNRADITQARQCLEAYVAKGCTIIADRGYDADHLRNWLTGIQAKVCIPPRRNRKIQYEYEGIAWKVRQTTLRANNQ